MRPAGRARPIEAPFPPLIFRRPLCGRNAHTPSHPVQESAELAVVRISIRIVVELEELVEIVVVVSPATVETGTAAIIILFEEVVGTRCAEVGELNPSGWGGHGAVGVTLVGSGLGKAGVTSSLFSGEQISIGALLVQ